MEKLVISHEFGCTLQRLIWEIWHLRILKVRFYQLSQAGEAWSSSSPLALPSLKGERVLGHPECMELFHSCLRCCVSIFLEKYSNVLLREKQVCHCRFSLLVPRLKAEPGLSISDVWIPSLFLKQWGENVNDGIHMAEHYDKSYTAVWDYSRILGLKGWGFCSVFIVLV